MKKYAVLGMDVEDWFHLDYFNPDECNQQTSTLDGLDIYLDLLKEHSIKTTFFVVGDIVEKKASILKRIISDGHEIALHSFNHKRPLLMTLEEFKIDTQKSIDVVRKQLDYEVKGFRAPCFSLDRDRLNILSDLGLQYDASKIKFNDHALYGNLDVSDFDSINDDIYNKNGFYEFETSTVNLFNKNLPISGGGYLRIFPWFITKFLLKRYLKKQNNYFFYIHPFEFSQNYKIKVPANTKLLTKLRFNLGRKTVLKKTNRLIKFLNENNYEFVKFEDLLA